MFVRFVVLWLGVHSSKCDEFRFAQNEIFEVYECALVEYMNGIELQQMQNIVIPNSMVVAISNEIKEIPF